MFASRQRLRRVGPGFASALLLAGTAWASGLELREVSHAWGLDFRHRHGGSGQRYMVETMVGGVVVFDYDGDGDPDVVFVDGGRLPGYQGEEPRTRLFRNEGRVGDAGALRFVDVTDRAGLTLPAYGCGGAAGDVDGDGDLDLYLTAFGPNALYRNEGDGTFTEVGAAAGVDDPRWNASAAFGDVDRDGDLDLYVVGYVDFALDNQKICGEPGRPGYCHPGVYNGLADRFYRNRGDGTFFDDTAAAGLSGPEEAGLGVVLADLDGDGWLDIYVANDKDPNLLFRNRGDGTFEDLSLLSGTAYDPNGVSEAGMGVEAADLDGDGRLDLVVTNFALETNALYWNAGNDIFLDRRFVSGFAEPSLRYLAFGVAAVDLDHDGDLDVVIANGHILDNAAELSPVKEYAQRNQVMENVGGGRFRERTDVGLDAVRVSRGLATGDFDLDGDLDLVIVSSNQPAEVYENLRGSRSGGWLQVDLEGRRSNRSGIGARLSLREGGRAQLRERRTASSYLAQNDLAVHFGVGAAPAVDALEVRWPSGLVQILEGVPVRYRILVVER
ncbi:MAG TPA: CRTAC1 family protein [Thermoanaerobaculia bacterium]|nr:CRTAC1 family protein [Thermoanaerobaculia bacterium]